MNVWEREYRDAVADITSPESLDEKILQHAKQFRPAKTENRWLSKAASGCTALAIVGLLVHPAQYLGALTLTLYPENSRQESPLSNWQLKHAPLKTMDPWSDLRSQVQADSYIELCQQWRSQQQRTVSDKLPRDLEDKAKAHCRLLP